MRYISKSVGVVVSLGILAVLLVTTAYLVYAAFSNTKRNLTNSVFENVTVAGGVSLGTLAADGSIKMKPTTSPPTCNSANEGIIYPDTTSHIVYYCNGTAWTSL